MNPPPSPFSPDKLSLPSIKKTIECPLEIACDDVLGLDAVLDEERLPHRLEHHVVRHA